ncbi:MAG: nucleotidyltransferase [Candidatus Dormibacteria bacterium]
MTGTITDAVLAAARLLDQLQLPHALCGGVAANLYREELRATEDVDFMVLVGSAAVLNLIEVAAVHGWRAERKGNEQLRLTHTALPAVDCLLAATEFEQSAIERAPAMTVEGTEVRVVAPSDLVILKLIAGRARDYEAVAAIINSRPDELDQAYIEEWLRQFGHEHAWTRAVEEARRELGD